MGRSPQARSLTDRIRNEAQVLGIDPQRLRRRVVFQRLLARVGVSSRWVVKGGFCLEVRFDLGSRGTKDLDLVAPTGWGRDGALDLQDELDELLSHDRDSDSFAFAVGAPRSVPGDGRELWRVPVEASLAGTVFAQVSLDIVVQEAELEGGVEELLVPPPLGASGFGAAQVLAVDVDQHAAEKIHAYSRTYAQDQPSSRVKDLVDLVLLIEAGVLDPARLGQRLVVVYAQRDGAEPPARLPAPPASWRRDYAALLAEHQLALSATSVDAAHELLTHHYAAVLAAAKGRP